MHADFVRIVYEFEERSTGEDGQYEQVEGKQMRKVAQVGAQGGSVLRVHQARFLFYLLMLAQKWLIFVNGSRCFLQA